MFVDLTQYGFGTTVRVAVGAVAWFQHSTDGTALHLVSGEVLRVAEPSQTCTHLFERARACEGVAVSDWQRPEATARIEANVADPE